MKTAPTPEQLSAYRLCLSYFVSFTDTEWALFCSHLYLKKLRKKELFVRAGAPCPEVAFTASGSLRYFIIRDGIEITSYFSFTGELASAYTAFLRQEASNVHIEAMEATELICFNFQSLQQLLDDPRTALISERLGRKVAEFYLHCYDERVQSFVTKSPEERYMDLLQQGKENLQRIPQHYIANFLGITAVSLSRIRSRIQGRGLRRINPA